MRGLLATAYAFGFAVFANLARRALRRSERHSARAQWCHERAVELVPPDQPEAHQTKGEAR